MCSGAPDGAPAGFEANSLPAIQRFDLSYSRPNDTLFELRLVSKVTGGSLLFVGTDHIVPPAPDLFTYLEGVVTREKPSEAYIEVDDVTYLERLPSDRDSVIRTRGEPSYLGFIARQSGVPVRPLELDEHSLFTRVAGNLPPDEVALAHVLRDVQIARDRQHQFGEALEIVASQSIVAQRKLLPDTVKARFPSNILGLTLAVNRHWPGLDWRQVPAEWANPLLTSQATGSRFVNAVFAKEKAIRDQHSLYLLLSRVAAGQRVVALAGRTHAETLLATLSCLMSQG